MPLSYEEKRNLIEKTLNPGDGPWSAWVQEMYDDRVVINADGVLYEVPYSIAEDGSVTLGERQRVRVTYEQYAELTEVEIFEAGTYRGKPYTEEDLDTMVANFAACPEIKPVGVIGHSEDQDLMKESGIPAAGWMTALKRVGKKLVASFADVPQIVAELIDRKAYKRTSAEIYTDYNGKGHAIRRVAWLGGEIPEVKTLQDVLALYADAPEGKTTWVSFDEMDPESTGKENNNMPTPEELQKQIDDLKAQLSSLEEEKKKLEADNADKTEQLSEVQKKAKRDDINRFCEDLKKEGKVIPAMQDMGLERFMEDLDGTNVVKFAEKGEEITPLAFMKKFLQSLPQIVRFGEVTPAGGKKVDGDFEASVEKYQEDNKVSRGKAISAVAKANPELHQEWLESQNTKN